MTQVTALLILLTHDSRPCYSSISCYISHRSASADCIFETLMVLFSIQTLQVEMNKRKLHWKRHFPWAKYNKDQSK